MDLQQWFYLLGIIFIVCWLLILISFVMVAIYSFRRYQKLTLAMKQRSGALLALASLIQKMPLSKIIPLVGIIPIVTKILMSLTQSKKRT